MSNIIGGFCQTLTRRVPFPVTPPWPDANNTGVPAGTVLTPSGSIVTSINGQVIEDLDITGTIDVRHQDVIIRRCRVRGDSFFTISSGVNGGGNNMIVEDCTISGTGVSGPVDTQGGILPQSPLGGSIIRRCNIFDCVNGILIGESHMQIRDTYIHDLRGALPDEHIDGIQGSGNFTDLIIEHNTISSVDTSCIILQDESAGFGGVFINNNLCIINGAASIFCQNKSSGGSGGLIYNITITNNVLTRVLPGSYTTISVGTIQGLTFTNNRSYTTGLTVVPNE